MAQVPEPLMRGDESIHIAPSIAGWGQWTALQHHLQDLKQRLGNLEVALIAGLMKGDEYLVGQPAGVALDRGSGAVVSLGVAHVFHSLPQ